ncbi:MULTISPECIES: DNA-formamidopyrimidine glycosylase family protein [Arthrobacter]|uniref:DNA-formamidopyrimidine glycosylase family protein n=2 Tax=Arthrobacter TaxID=1663 RepID=A0ABU9KFJ2_9MICC|nr:DNA-formamidopyrimidine glycosylase family protein [Arthrobacter sp. YJM1]MDP5225656.1 DNA-formamidopyrimidine glycosylase family protein [Arthrobacter sp. YJM1]
MPELPEVSGLRAFLEARLLGAVVDSVRITSFAVLKTADPPYTALEGRTVTAVNRFGKFVDLDADGIHFVFHLAKAGWLRFTEAPSDKPLKPGAGPIAARLRFTAPATAEHPAGAVGFDLTEAGTRKSLAVHVVRDPQEIQALATLGPEPLDPAFTQEVFDGIVTGSSQQIKGLLRSQSVIAGIGNAYSDEILHAAKVSPFAVAKSLDAETRDGIFTAIGEVLGGAVAEAVGKPPEKLKDAKRGGMRVHGRTGQPCPVCGDTVREVSFADRALQYCPTCQTKGKILADRRTSRFLK